MISSALLSVCVLLIPSGRAGSDFVEIRKICPSVRIELRYGTQRNGVRRAVYPAHSRCLLRRAVAERLCRVQDRLRRGGYGLLVWDGYRPVSAQKALWKVRPDRRFVAPPSAGSKHNRGAAVDLTLVTRDGKPLPMPSEFDEFSPRAHRDYAGGSRNARRNRDRLREAMVAEGFQADRSEWWHFQAPDWRRYPLADVALTSTERKR